MDKNLVSVCNKTIENYRYATERLRYDGDYINHFCALISGCNKRNINEYEIKRVRSLIREKTSNISPFRGDMLYILSFILVENNQSSEEFIDELLETFNALVDNGFFECGYLVLSAYSITAYVSKGERNRIYKSMQDIFFIMKTKYNSCTRQDDYLLCSLLAIEGFEEEYINTNIDVLSDKLEHIQSFNNNIIQAITGTIILYNTKDNIDNIYDFIKELDNKDLKLGQQFVNIIGLTDQNSNNKEFINKMIEVLKYLSDEEPEYYYYMDKDFSSMIAFIIVLMSCNNQQAKYIDEIIAYGVYCFLKSKNAGILNEVLA